jgi:hypothetical protein
MVAGASVASVTAHALLRDARIGRLTIGDPKGPNTTNFNRTPYDVTDVTAEESKAISFARQVHAQDPTQIIYLAPQGFAAENLDQYLSPSSTYPAVDLLIEAIDNIEQKYAILHRAHQLGLPIVQLADIGSKAIVSFNSPAEAERGESVVLGVSDRKLSQVLKQDFLQAAVYFVGLENTCSDEIGQFLQTKQHTPFAQTGPQMGSTALVAAGMATEQALRYLLNRAQINDFQFKRLIVDKKNIWIKTQNYPSFPGLLLNYWAIMRRYFSQLRSRRK